MPAQNSHSRVACGTINPFVFIQGCPNVELGALQATGAGVPLIGVGPIWTNSMMGANQQPSLTPQGYPAATVGQSVEVAEDGYQDMLLMVGSGQTVNYDDLLVSDASGYAKPINLGASGVQWIGARAIDNGVAGDVIRVQVLTRPYYNT